VVNEVSVSDQFADVVFPISLRKSFTYRIPAPLEGLAKEGMRCSVSFGRRQTIGLITALTHQGPTPMKAIKPINSLLDVEPSLTPDLMELGKWIAEYYYCSVGEALFAILPVGYRRTTKAILELLPDAFQKRQKVEEILEKIGKLRGVNWESLSESRVPLTARTRKLAEALKAEGLAGIKLDSSLAESKTVRHKRSASFTPVPKLHAQQQQALGEIEKAIEDGAFKTFLMHGVTGSGKTEVYLRAIAKILEKGKQAIVLIPEIALTPQTVERFTGRFGDMVAVFHSRLATGERTLEWRRMASGEAKVAVGARSALFAPARNLGLIIVDEEHESSYKQEDAPRYHARDAAIKRAQICRAVAVLGSATPSLESVHNSRTGKYSLLFLPDRVNRKPLPLIRLVDLREEWQIRGQDRPVLSVALQEAVRETLAKEEQALLFLNRRGFNTVALCLKCGAQVHCPDCSIPVTYHRGGKPFDGAQGRATLLCHYCNWQGPLPEKCAKCGDGEIKVVGLGTERVEEEVTSLFPKAKICRMDMDTTRREGSHEEIIGRFRRHEIDILIGTQMIAKGHDFPGVTLVGVVGADVGLALPDFRASERVFQLMVQVAGRAGRADKEGIIYLQTFHGEHPAIQAALKHDTGTFWKSELELREALGYPPYAKLGLLLYRAKIEKKALAAAENAARVLRQEAGKYRVEVRGPAPAGLSKLRGHYRFQVLLKSPKPAGIRRLIEWMDSKAETPPGVFRVVDLDPQSML
jgi:primosomal protein N' (replication factor Y) (superfamily II helicase)